MIIVHSEVTAFVRCDRCGGMSVTHSSLVADERFTEAAILGRASDEGWVREDHKDQCPACIRRGSK